MDGIVPKIDLHCHLDGSLSIKSIFDNMNLSGFKINLEDVKKKCIVSSDCNSLTEYLTKFDLPIKSMFDYSTTKNAAKEFMLSLQEDNMSYVEVRFAPSLLSNNNFSDKQVLEAVLEGLKEGTKETSIEHNVIICAMRHHTLEQNIAAYKLAKEYYGYGVCGVDLAGDENFYPTSSFGELFKVAMKENLNITIHAGECHSAQSIYDAISMGAKRIGHGIAMAGNKKLQMICKNKRIGIEMCPISNFQTGAVTKNENYPFREFLEEELLVTLNTDNRTVSDTSLNKEYRFIKDNYGLKKEEILSLYMNAVETSFASDDIKNKLVKMVKNI